MTRHDMNPIHEYELPPLVNSMNVWNSLFTNFHKLLWDLCQEVFFFRERERERERERTSKEVSTYFKILLFEIESQPMALALDDNSLLSDQDTNRFLV